MLFVFIVRTLDFNTQSIKESAQLSCSFVITDDSV